jgi:hypothetical protein
MRAVFYAALGLVGIFVLVVLGRSLSDVNDADLLRKMQRNLGALQADVDRLRADLEARPMACIDGSARVACKPVGPADAAAEAALSEQTRKAASKAHTHPPSLPPTPPPTVTSARCVHACAPATMVKEGASPRKLMGPHGG